MIHEVRREDGRIVYVLSAYECWRPGVFDSKKAAWHAQRLTDEEIEQLKKKYGYGVPLTVDKVRAAIHKTAN